MYNNGSSNYGLPNGKSSDTESTEILNTSFCMSDKGEYQREFSLSSIKIEIQREKTYIDDCFCDLCYNASCCLTSYLHSPIRRMWHNARYKCQVLIEHKYFEGVVLFLIGFSSITLVLFVKIFLYIKCTVQNSLW